MLFAHEKAAERNAKEKEEFKETMDNISMTLEELGLDGLHRDILRCKITALEYWRE